MVPNQCYYITSAYALQIVEQFDHPLSILVEKSSLASNMLKEEKKITSELFTRTSGGYMTSIPLVIEDCISSCRAPQDIPYHLRHFCRWNWNNYSKCDSQRESPLADMQPSDAWPGYPKILDDK